MFRYSSVKYAAILVFVFVLISMPTVMYGAATEEFEVKDVIIREKQYDTIVSKNYRTPYEISAKVTNKSGKLFDGELTIEFYDAKNQQMPGKIKGYLSYDKEKNGTYFYGASFFPYKNWKSCRISQFGNNIEEIINVEDAGTKFEVLNITVGKNQKIRGDIRNNSGVIYTSGTLILEGFNDKWQNMGYMIVEIQYDEDRETMFFETSYWTEGMEKWKKQKVLQNRQLSRLVEKKLLEGFEIENVIVATEKRNNREPLPNSIEGLIICKSGDVYRRGNVTVDILDEQGKRLCSVNGNFNYEWGLGMYFKESFRDISPKNISTWKNCKVVDYKVSENLKFDPTAEAKIEEELAKWKDIYNAVADKNYEKVNEFIQNGGDFNMSSFGDVSLLILSINLKNIDMVKLLVQNGADVNLRVKNRSPLSFALEWLIFVGGNEWREIVEYLQQQGATKEGDKDLKMKTIKREVYSPTPFWEPFK